MGALDLSVKMLANVQSYIFHNHKTVTWSEVVFHKSVRITEGCSRQRVIFYWSTANY